MSHATAAGSSTNHGSQHRPQEKYFNEKMVICKAQGVTREQLANELHKQGYLESVTGLQRLDFYRRFAVVIEDASVRDKLVECGLDIDGKHIIFAYHKSLRFNYQ